MPEDDGDHAKNQQRAEAILGSLHKTKTISDQDEVKHQQHRAPDKSPLLRKNREDDIRVLRRQKVEPVLGSVQISFAEESAGTYGDLRLNDVITCTQWITIRIKEGQDAIALIGFQEMPTDRQESQPGADQVGKGSQA